MSDILGIGHAVKHAAHDVSHTGNQIGQQIESGVLAVKHEAERGVLAVRHETESGLDAIRKELPDVESAITAALTAFEKALAAPLLKTIVNLLENAAPNTVWLSIGPVTFTVSHVPDKIDKVRSWVDRPPKTPAEIRKLIDDLAPDDIEVALKVNVPGTQSLTLGATLVYYPATFSDRLERIWKEIT